MPELPEVETVVRDLRPLLVGRRIASVRAGRKRLRRAWSKQWAARVGNIYADESLFAARLDPRRKGTDLKPAEAARLGKAVPGVLDRAIAARGSTIRDYVGGSGLRGGFQERFAVYGRTGQPCPRCGTPVERTRLAGRSTHYCPRCQK